MSTELEIVSPEAGIIVMQDIAQKVENFAKWIEQKAQPLI